MTELRRRPASTDGGVSIDRHAADKTFGFGKPANGRTNAKNDCFKTIIKHKNIKTPHERGKRTCNMRADQRTNAVRARSVVNNKNEFHDTVRRAYSTREIRPPLLHTHTHTVPRWQRGMRRRSCGQSA